MKKTANKGSGYLSQVLKEIGGLIDSAADRSELKKKLSAYVPEKILESYKNGIAAGKKQASRR